MIRNKLHLLAFFSSLLFYHYTWTMENKPSEQLKIMSFNIRRKGKEKNENRLWEKRLPLIISILTNTKPDIIGFQETTQEQIEDLVKSLPDNYKYFGTGRGQSWAGLGTDEATPIFYNADKLILKEYETFQLNKTSWYRWIRKHEEHGFLPRICTYGLFALKQSGKQLYIFNTHLDHEFEKARINQLKKILEKTEDIKKIPIIIMGDFNTDLVESITVELAKQDFINIKQLVKKTEGPDKTFTGWGDEPEKLIDHIVVKNSKDLQVEQYTVIEKDDETYPSDHRPVLIEII